MQPRRPRTCFKAVDGLEFPKTLYNKNAESICVHLCWFEYASPIGSDTLRRCGLAEGSVSLCFEVS